jgi:hypothetical protein
MSKLATAAEVTCIALFGFLIVMAREQASTSYPNGDDCNS